MTGAADKINNSKKLLSAFNYIITKIDETVNELNINQKELQQAAFFTIKFFLLNLHLKKSKKNFTQKTNLLYNKFSTKS